jgi:hypothetical protein
MLDTVVKVVVHIVVMWQCYRHVRSIGNTLLLGVKDLRQEHICLVRKTLLL